MQLDIFADSRDVMLRHDVLAAILARQPELGRQALAKLERAYPGDRQLAAFGILLQALENSPLRFADGKAALAARESLVSVLEPAAAQVMSVEQARLWLSVSWRQLAEAAVGLAYSAETPQAHAAALFLRAGEWGRAEACVLSIPAWRRIPLPLSWMVEARLAQHGLAASWPLLAELAWLSPSCFSDLVRRQSVPALQALLKDFDGGFENDGEGDADGDLAWFPAWCLIKEPSLAPVLRQSEPGLGRKPERAARLILELLALEHQGSHRLLLEQRKKLRSLQACLFQRYMRSR